MRFTTSEIFTESGNTSALNTDALSHYLSYVHQTAPDYLSLREDNLGYIHKVFGFNKKAFRFLTTGVIESGVITLNPPQYQADRHHQDAFSTFLFLGAGTYLEHGRIQRPGIQINWKTHCLEARDALKTLGLLEAASKILLTP